MMERAPSIDDHLTRLPADREERVIAVPDVVKTYLADVRAHLEWSQRTSGAGRGVNEANSDRIDRMSRSLFSQRFREVFQRTPMDYVREVRLRSAASMLRHTDLGVETIAGKVGYSSRTHFSKAFSEHFNLSPRDFRSALAMGRAPHTIMD